MLYAVGNDKGEWLRYSPEVDDFVFSDRHGAIYAIREEAALLASRIGGTVVPLYTPEEVEAREKGLVWAIAESIEGDTDFAWDYKKSQIDPEFAEALNDAYTAWRESQK